MPEWIGITIGIIIFVIIFNISVVLHEGGHALFAKIFKLNLKEYFTGFGSKIFSFKHKETEYGARWLPLGGYVKIEDDKYEEKSYERLALTRVHPMKRILIFIAGPLVNIILGLILVIIGLMMTPYEKPNTTLATVVPCVSQQQYPCGAQEAGLKPLDKITKINGQTVTDGQEVKNALAGKTEVQIEVNNNNKPVNVKLTNGQIGVTLGNDPAYRNFWQATTFIGSIVKQTINNITVIPETAPSVATSIITGERDEKAPGSVISTGKTYGEIAASPEPVENKVATYILISGLFNLGLGILNILPLLPLDGGKILIAIIDWIKMVRSKITKKTYNPVGQKPYTILAVASGIVVIGFMLLLILSDFSLLFRGNLP